MVDNINGVEPVQQNNWEQNQQAKQEPGWQQTPNNPMGSYSLPNYMSDKPKNLMLHSPHFWAGFGIGCFVGIITLIIVAFAFDGSDQTGLSSAYESCKNTGSGEISLDDGGKSMHVTESSSSDLETFDCVAGQVNLPDSIRNKMGQSTALSGQQSDTWDKYKITWSYNATSDYSALDVVFEENR